MSMIFNQYIKKSILLNILIVFLIFISLSSIIKLFDELHNLEKKNYFIQDIFFCIILNLPKEFDLFLPMSTLLGGLLGLSALEIRNELIIMQIAGLSKLQISIPIIKSAIFILLFNIISNEWLLPYSQKLVYAYKDKKQFNTYLFPEKNEKLWLTGKNHFFCIKKILTTRELLGIDLYYFKKNKKLQKILYIERAQYIEQHWFLLNITELDFSQKTRILQNKIPFMVWDTTLTPKLLSIIIVHPRILSMSNLKHCIQYFNKIGQNSKYYELIFWNKIISPITGVIMIITALSCTWGPLYKKKINIKLFFGVAIGFLFYILHQICGTFSIIYNVSPIIGAISPIMLLIIVNMIIFWKYL